MGETRGGWDDLRRIWLGPLFLVAPAAALALGVAFGIDWYLNRPPELHDLGPVALLFNYDLETLQNALGNLAQTVSAVMGLVITVVAIVVQLAATRYTPRVTELFFRERTNILVLGFFIVACLLAIWVSLSVGNGFLPRVSVVASLAAVTISLLLVVPYFAYVFDFLEPEKVVSRIQEHAVAATRAGLGAEEAQARVLGAVEQLADIAVAAVASQDKIISARAVDAMRTLLVDYLSTKARLPAAWFEPGAALCRNPDFLSMNHEALSDIARGRLWLEWKVLRQYQTAYNESLDKNPDMNYLIAINTRYVGEAALAKADQRVVGLVVKFMNTYLRATLNRRQVRTAYNILNQYRQLAESMIVSGAADLVTEIAGYLRYYGQTAHGMDLGFVTETISYDLATLCEVAHELDSPAHEALLAALLELDKEAESEAQEATLRGVRKAQARLATYYLQRGDEATARRIRHDMEQERPERLASIRDELLAVKSKDFWEVIDRGANFDYMDDARKALLRTFFGWFPDIDAAAAPRRTRRLDAAAVGAGAPTAPTGGEPARPAEAAPAGKAP